MVRHLAFILTLVCLPGITALASALPKDVLSPAQLARLSPGKPLVFETEVPGEPWPEMTIWELVKCSPEELAGVFWDSELDTTYLPGCLLARILSRPSPSVQKASFKLKMPLFLPNEVYAAEIKLIPQPPGVYKITWQALDSVYAKSCNGEIQIQPHAGMTLIRYRNFVVPKSKIAVLLRGAGRDRVIESVRALVAQTENEVRGSPGLLAQQRMALELAMGKMGK